MSSILKSGGAPKDFTNPVCEWHAHAGGKIFIHMKAPDGMIYPMNGTFTEITKPEKIVFNSAALDKDGHPIFEISNTIIFIAEEDKTKLIMHFIVTNATAEAAPHLGGMEIGWNMSLDKLVKLLDDQQ